MHVKTKGALIYNGAASGGSLNSHGIVYLADTDQSGANETVHIKRRSAAGRQRYAVHTFGQTAESGRYGDYRRQAVHVGTRQGGRLSQQYRTTCSLPECRQNRAGLFFLQNIETDGGLLASLDSVEKQRAVKATRRPIMSVAAMRHGLLRQRHIPRPPV